MQALSDHVFCSLCGAVVEAEHDRLLWNCEVRASKLRDGHEMRARLPLPLPLPLPPEPSSVRVNRPSDSLGVGRTRAREIHDKTQEGNATAFLRPLAVHVSQTSALLS